jgi:hypothetical protein
MKFLTLWFLLVNASTAMADMQCRLQTSNSRVEYADIRSWPELTVQRWYEDCVYSGPVSFCRTGRLSVIADRFRLCGYQVNQFAQCQTHEGWDRSGRIVETRCPAYGLRAVIQVDRFGEGRLTCSRAGRIESRRRLGQCY